MKRILVLCVLGLAMATSAPADIPSPSQSVVDPCVVLCPAGDVTLHVLVRGQANQPFPNATVDLEYAGCPGFALCALTGGEPYTHLSGTGFELVRVMSNAQGEAVFPVRAGGACPWGSVRVFADGIVLALRALASPDQNGDGIVGAADVAVLQTKLGTTDPSGDLNCDGTVDGADLAVLNAHTGHACALPTRIESGTWGRIKTLYR